MGDFPPSQVELLEGKGGFGWCLHLQGSVPDTTSERMIGLRNSLLYWSPINTGTLQRISPTLPVVLLLEPAVVLSLQPQIMSRPNRNEELS